jgi:hypothetical protein
MGFFPGLPVRREKIELSSSKSLSEGPTMSPIRVSATRAEIGLLIGSGNPTGVSLLPEWSTLGGASKQTGMGIRGRVLARSV